jgi:TetR/AcrR family transcriptional regulator, cholesterol catabolism regulator
MTQTDRHEAPPSSGAPTRSGAYLPVVGRQDQVQRRDRIVAAAMNLLQESEFDKVQIRDVAERAGIALATAYRYFSSKDHLYAFTLVHWSSDFFARVSAHGVPGTTDEERLLRMIQRTLPVIERWPQFVRAANLLDTSPDENAQAQMRIFKEHYSRIMELCIQDLPPEAAADVLMAIGAVYDMGVRAWALDRLTIAEVEHNLRHTVHLLFHGTAGAYQLADTDSPAGAQGRA